MLGGKKSLTLKGKYDVRAILGGGPLRNLTIDEIMDDINVTAAVLDTYTLIFQNCESVNLYDYVNDTLVIPELVIRGCTNVNLPAIVKSKVASFTNSTINVESGKKLHIDGDLVLTDSEFVGGGEVIVNGTLYADGDSFNRLDDWNITSTTVVDIGDSNRISNHM